MKFTIKMCKVIPRISIILTAVALCASGFKIESDFHVAGRDDNMYIPCPGSNPTAIDDFFNINDCVTCGTTCKVNAGSTVPSTARFTPIEDLINPWFNSTVTFNGFPVKQEQKKFDGTIPANQVFSVSQDNQISAFAIPGEYLTKLVVAPDGNPDNVAYSACCSFVI